MADKSLKVNIQKKLKEFDLEVDFELKKGLWEFSVLPDAEKA